MPTVERLLDQPIIRPHMDGRMGDNINGPAIIRVPDWLPNPLGRYYLYFSDHKGSYIRLAYADNLTGPWQIHTPGALDLSQSLFPAEDPPLPAKADRPAWAGKMAGGFLYAHIASPDVHIDHLHRRIRMYYHGLIWNGDQLTRIAYSSDGLGFEPRTPMLGPPYFRAFEWQDRIYVITWGGEIWRADHWDGPFSPGRQLIHYDPLDGIGKGFRHGEVHRVGTCLHIFYTRMGDCPERILHATVDLAPDWTEWQVSKPQTVLTAELPWEGGDLPPKTSVMGAIRGKVHELRDPCVFEDADGQLYLLYCGGGETGIGIARLSL